MRRNRLIEWFRGWCPKDSLLKGSKELASYNLMVRRRLGKILLYAGNLIAIFGSLVGYLFGDHLFYFFTPVSGSGYTGPTKIVTVGVRPQFFLITAICSALALVGLFISSKKLSARIFMGIGNLLVLFHSIVGLLGYYEIIRIFPWLYREYARYQPKPFVYTMFFSITTFGLLALIIGLMSDSDRIMTFVNTYIR